MTGIEKAGWNLACGNLAIFAIVCAVTLIFGGVDASAMMG
jgi:hypothetical protein